MQEGFIFLIFSPFANPDHTYFKTVTSIAMKENNLSLWSPNQKVDMLNLFWTLSKKNTQPQAETRILSECNKN